MSDAESESDSESHNHNRCQCQGQTDGGVEQCVSQAHYNTANTGMKERRSMRLDALQCLAESSDDDWSVHIDSEIGQDPETESEAEPRTAAVVQHSASNNVIHPTPFDATLCVRLPTHGKQYG